MGYVAPVEMDAGNSELRYMDDWDCVEGDYYGPISTFSSADIIAAAGARVPDSTAEDKHYRIGVDHDSPARRSAERGPASQSRRIHEQLQIDWNLSTLGRGTMDNSLFDDCNCNDVPDADDIVAGSPDVNGNGIPDECEMVGDVDGDGTVGILDFLLLIGAWGPCPQPCPPPNCLGDLDGDCEVGITDFLIVLGNWG